MLTNTFNTANFSADASRDPLPAGTYVVRILESSVAPLKSGNGHGLNITYEVIEGQHSKRRVWTNINVVHNNAEVQRIAQSELKKLCDACGGITLTETTTHTLVGKVLRIKLKIRLDPVYGDKNSVIGYEAAPNGMALPVMAVQSQGGPRPAPWASA